MLAVVVHGGAGLATAPQEQKDGVRVAAKKSMAVLRTGGHAIDAVLAGGVYLESGGFNAGVDSLMRFNPDTKRFHVQQDALIGTSGGLQGAVVGVEGVKHPLLLAAEVPKRTPHLLMQWGQGLERIAREAGLEPHPGPSAFAVNRFLQSLSAMTDAQVEEMAAGWTKESLRIRLRELHGGSAGLSSSPANDCDTIGVLALDSFGELAVASSTGGMGTMWIGRIGDVTEQESGWYISPYIVGAATGLGEAIKRDKVAGTIARRIVTESLPPDSACQGYMRAYDPSIPLGIIVLTIRGEVGIASNRDMPSYSIVEP